MTELGTLQELPLDYREALTNHNLLPLWPNLRSLLPYGRPDNNALPTLWKYDTIRPLLLQAGQLTPIEKAERRVLVLANPGLDLETLRATPSIYIGMQLILPGETAPNHRHTPSAIRFVVEGSGAYTTVEGEKLPMEKGDLILTPSGLWHEHGHDGEDPVIWLDALDLPLIHNLEASYAIEGEPTGGEGGPDSAVSHYQRSGLLPYKVLDSRPDHYPMRRYPWRDVRAALQEMAKGAAATELVQLAYVNPETGAECLPTLGFSAIMLRPGESASPPRRSASAVIHVIEGSGESVVNGAQLCWSEGDSYCVPTHAGHQLVNGSNTEPTFLFLVDDAPLQRKLGFYEVFPQLT